MNNGAPLIVVNPACAGMILSTLVADRVTGCKPRVCGDDPLGQQVVLALQV